MSALRALPRITARSRVQPEYFVAPEALPEGFDLREWSRRYDWQQDEWDGWRDTISPVEKTVRTERGDCDDYAAVAASWAIREGHEDVRFGYLWSRPVSHMVAIDGERVYSSGEIAETSFKRWETQSQYTWGTTWRIR